MKARYAQNKKCWFNKISNIQHTVTQKSIKLNLTHNIYLFIYYYYFNNVFMYLFILIIMNNYKLLKYV